MASEQQKVLGQVMAAAASAWIALGTVPSGKRWVVSTLNAANQGLTPALVSVRVRVNNAAGDPKQILVPGVELGTDAEPAAFLPITIGMTLGPNDVVEVKADATTVSFNMFGTEVTP